MTLLAAVLTAIVLATIAVARTRAAGRHLNTVLDQTLGPRCPVCRIRCFPVDLDDPTAHPAHPDQKEGAR